MSYQKIPMFYDDATIAMSYACPKCSTFWGTIHSAHDSAILECRKCHNVWEVFSKPGNPGELANLRKRIDDLTKQRNDVIADCDVLREENRQLIESNRLTGERLIQVTIARNVERKKTNDELESFRKLSGEFASLAKRDAIRDENKRLKQENQQHAQQIKSLQADLNAAHLRNITNAPLEEHEAVWSINWENKVKALKSDISKLTEQRDDLNEKLAATLNERDLWKSDAEQESRNSTWYRGILDAIGAFFGDAAKTNDAGEVTDGIFYSKLPALVKQNLPFRFSDAANAKVFIQNAQDQLKRAAGSLDKSIQG